MVESSRINGGNVDASDEKISDAGEKLGHGFVASDFGASLWAAAGSSKRKRRFGDRFKSVND